MISYSPNVDVLGPGSPPECSGLELVAYSLSVGAFLVLGSAKMALKATETDDIKSHLKTPASNTHSINSEILNSYHSSLWLERHMKACGI